MSGTCWCGSSVNEEVHGDGGGTAGRPWAREPARSRGVRRLTTRDSATDGDRELRIGRAAGKSLREIAEDLYGPERVAPNWDGNSVLRARTRRLLRKIQVHARRV